MTLAEYLVGLVTIVTGVAVTDLVQRIAALIEHRREIRWDWLPLLLVGVAFLTLLITWAVGWQTIQRNSLQQFTLGRFLMGFSIYVLVYLMSAAMLPRDPQPGLDLRTFCERQTRPYWLLFTMILSYFGVRTIVWPWLTGPAPPDAPAAAMILLALSVAMFLVFSRRRLWHALGGFVLLALLARNLMLTF